MNVLSKPYTKKELKALIKENDGGHISGVVQVSLQEIIDYDFEDFIDLISERLTDCPCLMDVSYKVVGVVGENILIEVTGDASECFI